MTKKEELYQELLDMISDDNDLFCDLVDELDSWSGFADCYRCWPMSELDEFVSGMSATALLEKLTNTFCINDDYFYWSIYGLESTDDKFSLYDCNTDPEEVLYNVLKCYNHIYLCNDDFEHLLHEYIDLDDEADDTEEGL